MKNGFWVYIMHWHFHFRELGGWFARVWLKRTPAVTWTIGDAIQPCSSLYLKCSFQMLVHLTSHFLYWKHWCFKDQFKYPIAVIVQCCHLGFCRNTFSCWSCWGATRSQRRSLFCLLGWPQGWRSLPLLDTCQKLRWNRLLLYRGRVHGLCFVGEKWMLLAEHNRSSVSPNCSMQISHTHVD